MTIVTCQCGARFQARDHLAGRTVACPRCAQPLEIPSPAAAPLAPLADPLWGSLSTAATALAPAASPAPWTPPGAAAEQPASQSGGWGCDFFPRQSTRQIVPVLVLSVCGLGLFSLLILATLFKLNSAVASNGWPATTASVTQSELTVVRRLRRNDRFELKLTYHYHVEGRVYFGSQASNAPVTEVWEARRIAHTYQAGSSHPVYYNPNSPGEAVLERGVGYGLVAMLLVSSIALLGCVAGILFCGLTLLRRLA